jgi:FkbM family methyltransferase
MSLLQGTKSIVKAVLGDEIVTHLLQGRRFVNGLLGRDILVRPAAGFETEFHGTEYGGWTILKESLDSTSVVYSFGIGDDASFDLSIANRYGCTVDAFDPTPRSLDWMKRQAFGPRIRAHGIGLAAQSGEVEFYEPADPNHVSYSAATPGRGHAVRCKVAPLQEIVRELGHARIDLLKMDVEGSEYEVIETFDRASVLPKQLLVEFHHRMLPGGVARTRRALRQLESLGFELFAVSRRGEEFSFVRRDTAARA